nr:hypothetical protein [Tanacetum cinerariifolium]
IEGGLDLVSPGIRLTKLKLGLVGKDITPIAVYNINSFYESKSSQSELEDLNKIDIETLTLEQYPALNRNKSQVGVRRPGIGKDIVFEIKSQLLRELRKNTFSGGKTGDSMEYELVSNKIQIEELSMVKLNARCSAMWKNELPPKEKDPGSFVLPCIIGNTMVSNALADLRASISVMPFSMFKRIGLGNPILVNMDNNPFPNYEAPGDNPPSPNKSQNIIWNPVEEFQDSDDNLRSIYKEVEFEVSSIRFHVVARFCLGVTTLVMP